MQKVDNATTSLLPKKRTWMTAEEYWVKKFIVENSFNTKFSLKILYEINYLQRMLCYHLDRECCSVRRKI